MNEICRAFEPGPAECAERYDSFEAQGAGSSRHVEDYKSDCGFQKLGILKQPRITPCEEGNRCNKCIKI